MTCKSYAVTTTLTLLLVVAVAVAAQAEGYFGFQGGANFANLKGDFDAYAAQAALDLEAEVGGTWSSSPKGRTGFSGGLTYALMYKPVFGFQVEAMYTSRGARIDFATGGVQAEARYKFDYVEIPLMLRYNPTHAHSTQVLFMLGPILGFKTNSSVQVSGVNAPDWEGSIDQTTSTIFGVTGAVVFRLNLGEKSAVHFQTRYYNATSNAIDSSDFTVTSKDFTLLAGMEFALGE